MGQRPLRIGHRGAAGLAPENTLASIELALSLGVDAVEIDVHRSRDGQLIVMHDERVDRTTNGVGYIRDLTRAQIQAPTLSEALMAVRGRAALMIEIKVRGIAREVVAAAAACPEVRVFHASFLHSELLLVREADPAARTIALIDAAPVSPIAFATDARATHAGIGFSSLERDAVRELHRAEIQVFTWTVDDPRDIDFAIGLGVDGVISNFPDRLPRGQRFFSSGLPGASE